MITLSPEQEAAVAGPVTAPQFLIEIELDQPYFFSTRADVTVDGNAYVAGDVQLGRVSHDHADLMVINTDYRHTGNALDGVYLRSPVRVLWAYDQDADPAPAPIVLFEGIISANPQVGEWLSVTCRRTPPRVYPFTKLRPPLANHLPSAGYMLQFDGQVLRIEVA